MAASALLSSGCPGRAVATDAGRDHRQGVGECRERILGANFGELDIQPERFRPVAEEVAIAEQVEWRQLQFIPAQPRLDGDVGPDTRGFA